MALVYIRQISPHATLGLWEMKEPLSSLIEEAFLSANDLETVNGFKQERRKLEWISVRMLLNEMLGKPAKIIYSAEGKPSIEHSATQLSISHSGSYVAILLSRHSKAGIDIQEVNAKVNKAPGYFLHETEVAQIPDAHRAEMLHVYWSAKEALYKYHGGDIDLKDGIRIMPFAWVAQGTITGHIIANDTVEKVSLKYEMMGKYLLVYTVSPLQVS